MQLIRKNILFFACIIWYLPIYADTIHIVEYNVENLFDNRHDTLKQDWEFTPEGARHWTWQKWQYKLDMIAQVISNISPSSPPMIVGLCEIENNRCMEQLCSRLRYYSYKSILFDGNDERGIDVALLYDSTKFHPFYATNMYVDLLEDKTRDILYVKGDIMNTDTLHIMVCHLPSQLGGKAESEWKRIQAKKIIQHITDSILHNEHNAKIIVMGDMNEEPNEDLLGLKNQMLSLNPQYGTHKYQGIWTYLDQFYVSTQLQDNIHTYVYSPKWLLEEDNKYLGYKPKRTFVGYKYQKGYSDHLPIVLQWIRK